MPIGVRRIPASLPPPPIDFPLTPVNGTSIPPPHLPYNPSARPPASTLIDPSKARELPIDKETYERVRQKIIIHRSCIDACAVKPTNGFPSFPAIDDRTTSARLVREFSIFSRSACIYQWDDDRSKLPKPLHTRRIYIGRRTNRQKGQSLVEKRDFLLVKRYG